MPYLSQRPALFHPRGKRYIMEAITFTHATTATLLNAGSGTTPSAHIKKLSKKRSTARAAEKPADSAFAWASTPQNVSKRNATNRTTVKLREDNLLIFPISLRSFDFANASLRMTRTIFFRLSSLV